MKKGQRKDLTGQRFTGLVVLGFHATVNARSMWECKCDCGRVWMVSTGNLQSGGVTRCRHCTRNRLRHGGTVGRKVTQEYNAWQHAKTRCYNPKSPRYKNYGARGIKMCDDWLNSFENFLRDMGNKPSPKHTLERKDVHGDYTKENCIWLLGELQPRNKTTTRELTAFGEKMILADFLRKFGFASSTKVYRLERLGFSFDNIAARYNAQANLRFYHNIQVDSVQSTTLTILPYSSEYITISPK